MILRYENTVEDLIAFNRDYIAHSPTIKHQIRANHIWLTVGVFFVELVLLRALDPAGSGPGQALVALFCAGLLALMYPSMVRRHQKKILAKLIAEKRDDTFIGPHELEITDSGLVERSRSGETRTAWHAVQEVRGEEGR